MKTTRRQLLQQGLAGAALLASATARSGAAPAAAAARRPNSRIAGVQLGVITYSFRSMPDQSAEALLRYCREIGISAVELMGDPAEWFAGIPVKVDQPKLWAAFARKAPGQPPLSPAEQHDIDAIMANFEEYKKKAGAWRASASMKPFEQLRQMYNAAGVSIYGFKPDVFGAENSDAEVDYGMRAARALGASHVTVELPDDPAQSKRLGLAAARYGLRVGYHQHLQATPTLWDTALGQTPANSINLDLGHYTAAADYDGLAFMRAHANRIVSMHLKDRHNKAHGQANMPWGEGDTPIAAALRLMRDQHFRFPGTIEFEYDVPPGSDAVREVARCLEFCRKALTTS